MDTTKIGWIGLGKMGNPMAQRLMGAGYAVTVYNRSAAKAEQFKALGATISSSPAELLLRTDVLFIMVSDDQAIQELFTDENGLLGAKAVGRIIINMSTVSPSISQKMATLVEEQGNYYLDAPVSGSVKQVEDGTLVIMVGGPLSAYNQVKLLLGKMGRLVQHVGNTGAGNTAKLVINTLLGIYAQGLSEAFTFAKQQDIKPEDLSVLLKNSALNSPLVTLKIDQLLGENYKPMFSLRDLAKDLRLAKDLGMSTPLGLVAYQTYQDADPTLGGEDIIAVVKQLGQ